MFKQLADGKFSVHVEGPFHCGPDHTSPKTFEWNVEVCWPDDALDPKGFLFDNEYFKQYFDGLQVLTDSCELFVLKAAKHIKAQAKTATSVSVGLRVPGLAKIINIQP